MNYDEQMRQCNIAIAELCAAIALSIIGLFAVNLFGSIAAGWVCVVLVVVLAVDGWRR